MSSKRSLKTRVQKSVTGWLFVLPCFIFFIIFVFLPILMGFFYSFTNYTGLSRSMDFVGLKNYINLFKDRYFIGAIKNNIIYSVLFSISTMVLALIVSVLLNKAFIGKAYFKIAFFLPYLTSMVSVALIWKMIFNPYGGPLNTFLEFIGISNPPKWLASSDWALYAVIIVAVWKDMGYYMLIFMAGLQNIPVSLYEAASIDGANEWHAFTRITIPMLSPTIFLNSVILTINSFQVFDLINVMTGGGPGKSTNVLAFRIYEEAFKYGRMGYGSAIAYFLFFVIMILTLIQFKVQKRWVNYV